MSDQQVTYELSLKDGLSPKVDEATGHVGKLEKGLESVKETGLHMLEAIGIGFAIFKGVEFIHAAKEEWEKLEFATSQVEAGLESTRGAAGLTFEELKTGATEAAHNIKFTQAEIMGMQSILLTFPGVTKQVFGEASQAIYDMSTRLGQDLKSTAIQVGKALQDPEKGVTALRRVGVNFNETQMETIKNLVATGQAAKAQALILKELQGEFAGSAEAAAKADVGFRYEKSMEELKITIGEVADKLSAVFMPALEAMVDGFKAAVDWAKRNADLLKAIGIGAAVAATALGIYELVTNASAIVTWALTGAQTALNAVMAVSPITWIIVGLGALVTAIIYCYKHFAGFRATLLGVWETVKEFGRIVGDIFMGVGKVIAGVLTLSPSLITEGFNQTLDAATNAGNRLGHAFKKGYDEGMSDFNKDHKEQESLIPKKIVKGAKGETGAAAKEPKTKATGSKSVTINVSIKDLIGVQNINTTNLKEGAGKIKDLVLQALSGAVNDFQVVADH